MKIIISPAKSLNFEKKIPFQKHTLPNFLTEAQVVHTVVKKKNPKQLMELMDISEKLANLNWKRNQDWSLPFTPENARQAVFAFDGEVYIGLDAYSLTEVQLQFLQERLFILSGWYGILRPLDLIQAYRLEMGTSLAVKSSKNLYEFWKTKATEYVNKALSNDDIFVNLASSEYASVLDFKKIKATVITPEFKDYKDGRLKMISFFAKKARGLMVRFIAETNAVSIDDLKKFNYEGYAFDANLSTANKLVFTR
jgi:uncharacterized protein